MFFAEDDEVESKISLVRPNDVIDLEISPKIRRGASWIEGNFEKKQDSHNIPPPLRTLQKDRKPIINKTITGAGKRKQASPMKRGDPFLPSVICDENPFADIPMKKNSRKKPTDCKCKGLGYNLSPSAMLPEEMRQQWGVGVFGKTAPIGHTCMMSPKPSNLSMALSSSISGLEGTSLSMTKRNFSNVTQSKGDGLDYPHQLNCAHVKCKGCKNDLCTCVHSTMSLEAIRIHKANEAKRGKPLIKSHHARGRDYKSQAATNKFDKPFLKRIACYSNKDNSNIISTSNFNKNNNSFTPVGVYNPVSFENDLPFKTILCGNQGASNRTSAIKTATVASKQYGFNQRITPDGIPLSGRSRYRHQIRSPRRLVTSTSLSTLPSGDLKPSPTYFDPGKPMVRSTSMDMMMNSQNCSCDSCRRRARWVSRIPSPSTKRVATPFLYSSAQRYQSSTISTTPLGRFSPYSPPTYPYSKQSQRLYIPVDIYGNDSKSTDYSFNQETRQEIQATLPLAHAMHQLDSSPYLDEPMPASPSMSTDGTVDDLTDLSIKETVDFFVKMKPPLESPIVPPSSPSPEPFGSASYLDETSVMSPSDFSQGYSQSSSYFPKNSFSNSSITSINPLLKEELGKDTSRPKRNGRYVPGWPRDVFYSSLVSDLEDELRCAIENIPIE